MNKAYQQADSADMSSVYKAVFDSDVVRITSTAERLLTGKAADSYSYMS